MTRPILQVPIGFAPSAIDKVERLLEVLTALREDRVLTDAFVLHGGTALNLFLDDAPRLSVDIDLLFVAEAEVDAMRRVRTDVDARLRRVIQGLGYIVQASRDEHSGRTYRVKYPGDYVKVDISYLARVPLLRPQLGVCELADPTVHYPTLQLRELVAGKIKALVERLAARDLYDLWRVSVRHPAHFDDPLARACAFYALSSSDPFPFVREPAQALDRFEKPSSEFTAPLFAMLRTEDTPEYGEMLSSVRSWLEPLSVPTSAEHEYMCCLDDRSECRPELLFAAWPEVVGRARRNPVMQWKVHNLAKRSGLSD